MRYFRLQIHTLHTYYLDALVKDAIVQTHEISNLTMTSTMDGWAMFPLLISITSIPILCPDEQ